MQLRRLLVVTAAMLLATPLLASSAQAASADVVISQVYGGGGNSGAPYTNDFIELTNLGTAPVDLAGWSVQYSSAAGTTYQVTPLTGSLASGAHYLIAEAAGAAGTSPLPTPDATGSTAMSAASGKVALVRTATALACGASCATAPDVQDFVGYGTANDFESAATPALSNTTAALRNAGPDTDNNAADFAAGTPTPRNTGGGGPTEPPPGTPATIAQVQGPGHVSPLAGQRVTDVEGIVTAKSARGFWIQDATPDADPKTSDAVLVFQNAAPAVAIGDAVTVAGTVSEFRPGNDANNLSTTEITGPTVVVTASGQPVPAPVLIGPGGRTAPIPARSDAPGDVEASSAFDPATSALDFYEALEGTLLRVTNAVATGPTASFGEIPVLPGNAGGPRTVRGGVRYTYGDPNAEKIFLDDVIAPLPTVDTGDALPGTIDGVLDYSFGNFKLEVLATPAATRKNLPREVTARASADQLTVATFNVENLDPGDDPAKVARLAGIVVTNLRAPDVVVLEEIQDNNGATSDGTVAADQTYAMFIDAIVAAGGPRYQFRQIDPENLTDGGEPGGNIRVGFLFNPSRVSFTDRAGGNATTPTQAVRQGGRAALSLSPGRIDPANPAFANSRKPLAGEFKFRGATVFVIANHFNSKGGDQPLFGRFQPPTRSSETQRAAQATAVRGFVNSLLAIQPTANVIVAGDLNDFEFSRTVSLLTDGGALVDLPTRLPASERYTYVFDGNSQTLDHMLLSRWLALPGLVYGGFTYDIVHVNSEYADQASDHDPQIVRVRPRPF